MSYHEATEGGGFTPIIHGSYDTTQRINYLLWQTGKARMAGDGRTLLVLLQQLMLETRITMNSNQQKQIMLLWNKAVREYKDLIVENNKTHKTHRITSELDIALHKLEEELRLIVAAVILPQKDIAENAAYE